MTSSSKDNGASSATDFSRKRVGPDLILEEWELDMLFEQGAFGETKQSPVLESNRKPRKRQPDDEDYAIGSDEGVSSQDESGDDESDVEELSDVRGSEPDEPDDGSGFVEMEVDNEPATGTSSSNAAPVAESKTNGSTIHGNNSSRPQRSQRSQPAPSLNPVFDLRCVSYQNHAP